MKARELMTTSVLSVEEDTPARRIAQLLLDHGISAVPVVNAGRLVGIGSGRSIGMGRFEVVSVELGE